jgi:hypothetical protein
VRFERARIDQQLMQTVPAALTKHCSEKIVVEDAAS